MQSVGLILNEFNKLKFEQQKILVYKLFDKLLNKKENVPKVKSKSNFFSQYRGIAKGFWNTDAQEYINNLRDADRF